MGRRIKRTIKLVVWSSWIVAFSLYAVTPTFARGSTKRDISDFNEPGKAITQIDERRPGQLNDGTKHQLRILTVKVLSRDGKVLEKKLSAEVIKKLNKALSKAFVSPEPGKAWDCFVDCLGDFGVSVVSATLCIAACIVTGGILCAICLGVSVTVVEFCGLGCALYAY